MGVRPGGIFSIDIATADGQEFPNLGCILDVIPMQRLVWTSMLFPGYRPAIARLSPGCLWRHSDHCHRDNGERGSRHSLRLHGTASR